MNPFLDTLKQRVLLCDGAMGTLLQDQQLDLVRDFQNCENCSEILTLTRPDVVESIHRAYLEAGADCIEANTFGANKIVLDEFNLGNKVYELSYAAGKIARDIANEFSTKKWPRFVIGSIGPGTKLPSLGHISYDEIVAAHIDQARGLLDAKVDAILLETHQDLLAIKAILHACRLAKEERSDNEIPLFVQVTLEANGKLLTGSDIDCVITTLSAMQIDGIGLNCSMGPTEMQPYIATLSKHWPGFISVMPNAGLPMIIDGQTTYPLLPVEFAHWQQYFVEKLGVNLIGGCCGTTPKHIQTLHSMLDARSTKTPIARSITEQHSISSLYTAVPYRQENTIFMIGEQLNANGTQCRTYLNEENWDALSTLAKDQEDAGAHALDICMNMVGREECSDIQKLLSALRLQCTIPFMIDTTTVTPIETGLKLLAGKSIINSINFEDGGEHAEKVLRIAKQFGAAIVGLTIDEIGMAKSIEEKLTITERLYDLVVNQYGLPPQDLFIDTLTFTICTGVDEERENAIHTLGAIEKISQKYPKCQLFLGISNISFGLNPAARQVLNTVFLQHAQQRGLTAAIVPISKIMPLYKIPEEQRVAAENLIFNRWINQQDPLLHFIELFKNAHGYETQKTVALTLEEQLVQSIINGEKAPMETLLQSALKKYSPMEIINHYLLAGMQTVGKHFESGKTQLPFLLQSAEAMKYAIQLLEPYLTKHSATKKGILLLATVAGDVHDIGKNLVDIILSNNGFHVINLGIKQTIQEIMAAIQKYKPDVLGLSGLLVKSSLIMRDNLATMQQKGLTLPVILGGAALTRTFVENECRNAYKNPAVYYAKDAFATLKIMETLLCHAHESEHGKNV